MTNNTIPNLTILISTYIKLAWPKPSPIHNKNSNDGNKVVKAVRVNLVFHESDNMEPVPPVTRVQKLFTIPFQFTLGKN
jgi:hypothetical protein